MIGHCWEHIVCVCMYKWMCPRRPMDYGHLSEQHFQASPKSESWGSHTVCVVLNECYVCVAQYTACMHSLYPTTCTYVRTYIHTVFSLKICHAKYSSPAGNLLNAFVPRDGFSLCRSLCSLLVVFVWAIHKRQLASMYIKASISLLVLENSRVN